MRIFRIFIAALILSLPMQAIPAERASIVHTPVNVATASTQVTSGALRVLLLQNISDTTIWCNLAGGTAVVGQGFGLNPAAADEAGGALFMDVVLPAGAVTCIHGGSGSKVLLVTAG